MNLISTLMVIAIVAIVGAMAIPNWAMEMEQATGESAVAEGQATVRALTFAALAGQGAILQQSGTAMTVSANSGAQWDTTLPSGWTLQVNGSSLRCVSLNSMGQPTANTTSPACSFVPANQMQPLQWSVHHASQTLPLS
ncbi:hypothetical protein GGI1_11683 [Acidithiobacillus sp. GGI-221]|nr:hypothetical protein GGI1_11683 [Acidithiobacillus sp. GGI-221]